MEGSGGVSLICSVSTPVHLWWTGTASSPYRMSGKATLHQKAEAACILSTRGKEVLRMISLNLPAFSTIDTPLHLSSFQRREMLDNTQILVVIHYSKAVNSPEIRSDILQLISESRDIMLDFVAEIFIPKSLH